MFSKYAFSNYAGTCHAMHHNSACCKDNQIYIPPQFYLGNFRSKNVYPIQHITQPCGHLPTFHNALCGRA